MTWKYIDWDVFSPFHSWPHHGPTIRMLYFYFYIPSIFTFQKKWVLLLTFKSERLCAKELKWLPVSLRIKSKIFIREKALTVSGPLSPSLPSLTHAQHTPTSGPLLVLCPRPGTHFSLLSLGWFSHFIQPLSWMWPLQRAFADPSF